MSIGSSIPRLQFSITLKLTEVLRLRFEVVDPESLNLDQVLQLCTLEKKSRCAKARDGGASLEATWGNFIEF